MNLYSWTFGVCHALYDNNYLVQQRGVVCEERKSERFIDELRNQISTDLYPDLSVAAAHPYTREIFFTFCCQYCYQNFTQDKSTVYFHLNLYNAIKVTKKPLPTKFVCNYYSSLNQS